MDADVILAGPRLKVIRAHHHIDTLLSITKPLWPGYYELIQECWSVAPDADPHRCELTYQPKDHLAGALAVVIGDAVHNLRAALDHLATGIIRTHDPKAKPYFPIHPERKSLETAPDLARIEANLPGAKKLLLEEIRPENGPNEHLWLFNDLDNADKHSLILPTISVTKIETSGITLPGGTTIGTLEVSGDATRPINLIRDAGQISIDDNFKVTASVLFGEGTLFKNKPVIPTLMQIADIVTDTLDQFEALIRKAA